MARPIGVDLFSGAGGLSLGFEQAGFDVVASVEIDPVHAATHKFNFPNCAVLPRSVVGLSAREIRTAAGIGKRRVDVVFGGAPCQGFSLIGHRSFDDPRNRLVLEFVRLVAELEATYFVFENVKGLTVGKHRRFLEELVREFEKSGYVVQLPWQVLNASDFGVPQSRERLILFGASRGAKQPRYPTASTYAAGGHGVLGLKRGPSVSDALDDLPDAEAFAELVDSDEVRVSRWRKPTSAYGRKLRCLDNDSWEFGHPRKWDPALLTSSMRTDHTPISRRRFAATAEGDVEPISRFFKLPARGISNTLRAGTDSARGAFTSPRPVHHRFARCVTVREMARLHGFPDWFRFHETKWHGARQIGNAVPPPLAKAVAESVMVALGRKPTKALETLALGDVALLRLTPDQAASMFGIDNPIGRRDRKSGAKKRKQADIERERVRLSRTAAAHG